MSRSGGRAAPRGGRPAPLCLLKGFGDSALELELRIWIKDHENGVANVKSKEMLGV